MTGIHRIVIIMMVTGGLASWGLVAWAAWGTGR